MPIWFTSTTCDVIAGKSIANRDASIPPIECPTIAARSTPSERRRRRVFNAMSLNVYGMSGFDDRPKPIWSGTMTRKPSRVSTSIVPAHASPKKLKP